jgi:hypothetical protein
MTNKLLALMLLVGGSAFAATHVSIGIGIGGPASYGGYYAPAPLRPPCPGPGYTWVDGYWGPSRVWVNGYWAAPYGGSYGSAPRYRDWDHDRRWRRDWDRDEQHDRGWGWGHRR